MARSRCSAKKGVRRNFAKFTESTCVRASFLINCRPEAGSFIKKETRKQAFPCELCEIFKNTFFIYLFNLFNSLFLVGNSIILRISW